MHRRASVETGQELIVMDSGFEATLSLERFTRYFEWAEGDRLRVLEPYALNTQLSEALYTPLQIL